MLKVQPAGLVPTETARIARQILPNGNRYLTLRDELGSIYSDRNFSSLFPTHGQPAQCPWRLALVSVMQFAEDLSDRQAAEAVKTRIDWKYALGLKLANPGFDFSVLSEFRTRLLSGGQEEQILDLLLERLREKGWLKAGEKQRTDSTHVLAAIRTLNRLEGVGETLRATLNDLSTVAPDWLQAWIPSEWFDRYSRAIEEYRLPKGIPARQTYAETVGRDGIQLLNVIYEEGPDWLRQVPSVEVLRQTWVHQYFVDAGKVRLRSAKDLPPAGQRYDSPYDPQARYGNKRSTTWTGYKVHLTETCDKKSVHLITHVETTQGHLSDTDQTQPIHEALSRKALSPKEHIVDAGYVDGSLLVESLEAFDTKLVGPVRPDVSWQGKVNNGYDLSHFQINWKQRQMVCPEGKKSIGWTPAKDAWNNDTIRVKFSRTDCRLCPNRGLCTKRKTEPRSVTLRPHAVHKAIQANRRLQSTKTWKKRYNVRAGIEGTLSQGVRVFGMRQTRYIGLAKTHLQHLLTAAAMNIVRIARWLDGVPHAKTRTSRFAALRPCA
ncbi:Transposase, IS4 family protein [Synechococcus sp. PCC 7335]|uniref:IS1182 family transposase n=1 Tax=Synechococcus sp. (strain ATCC 29403 / PCC 7335) TaxID=91464 RepID=UPI00017EB907|nr:IS1182 family transposase [Synechococcus sp. PCC 7335]EDX83258.1 Transposase, IS4 family protein [Synechococcus sp. PCC 7335]